MISGFTEELNNAIKLFIMWKMLEKCLFAAVLLTEQHMNS